MILGNQITSMCTHAVCHGTSRPQLLVAIQQSFKHECRKFGECAALLCICQRQAALTCAASYADGCAVLCVHRVEPAHACSSVFECWGKQSGLLWHSICSPATAGVAVGSEKSTALLRQATAALGQTVALGEAMLLGQLHQAQQDTSAGCQQLLTDGWSKHGRSRPQLCNARRSGHTTCSQDRLAMARQMSFPRVVREYGCSPARLWAGTGVSGHG